MTELTDEMWAAMLRHVENFRATSRTAALVHELLEQLPDVRRPDEADPTSIVVAWRTPDFRFEASFGPGSFRGRVRSTQHGYDMDVYDQVGDFAQTLKWWLEQDQG